MKIAVASVARSDYGIYRPVLRRLVEGEAHEVEVWAASAHLSPQFGMTVEQIEADGFAVGARLHTLMSSDAPVAVAKSMGLGVSAFAEAIERRQPDLLMVLGDRFDMFVAGLAALPFNLPVAHLHGGELTLGAIDDALRHALTKLSHLHFVSTEPYRQRVLQLGEQPERVITVGAPSLDGLVDFKPLTLDELRARFGATWPDPFLLVTLHSETLAYENADHQIETLLGALDDVGRDVVFTMPNADTGGARIRAAIEAWLAQRPRSLGVETLGQAGFWSAMHHAEVMVGNSSAGLIEAPSFKTPVVNIGDRQAGRVRGSNVVDVAFERQAIVEGVARARSEAFAAHCTGDNPYFIGGAADRIAAVLSQIDLGDLAAAKHFQDLPPAG